MIPLFLVKTFFVSYSCWHLDASLKYFITENKLMSFDIPSKICMEQNQQPLRMNWSIKNRMMGKTKQYIIIF